MLLNSFQLTVCVSDGRISNGRINAFPMKDMLGHTRQTTQVDRSTDAPVSTLSIILICAFKVLKIYLKNIKSILYWQTRS